MAMSFFLCRGFSLTRLGWSASPVWYVGVRPNPTTMFLRPTTFSGRCRYGGIWYGHISRLLDYIETPWQAFLDAEITFGTAEGMATT